MMNLDGKTKESLNARRDLEEMGIRRVLHPMESNRKIVLSSTCYSMSNDEKKKLCWWLVNLKVLDSHSSNISRCVNAGENQISGMKTHDCHVFVERLLPLIVSEMLPRHVSEAVIKICEFFKNICANDLKDEDLECLETKLG
ncbi:hypothetical protein Ddye_025657 [Dipteronia dyeriana]|uniref:Uncharacterized protein n=1 Tax=Dipteronia dyeriana TaxID=168575 RepID=A0AAD9WPM8_9ROSI|nr:hypothetical protein Ddye_025657 [Dipteronia dyeriana]